MVKIARRLNRLWILLAALCFARGSAAQTSPDLFSGLQWRNVGPYHGGRIAAVTGVIGEPGTFYVGLPQGGIWKTTSGGMTWYPVFDQVTEVDSIGAVQVAPSNPNVIYAGSGDAVLGFGPGNDGNGMYKSTDAGKTWVHIGLEGTKKIPKIIVDPRDYNLVIVVAMGGFTGTQRGVFRTENGGQTWTNVLHVDDETGGRDLSSPFDEPNVIFATTTAEPKPAPANPTEAPPTDEGPSHTKVYKSLDEGKTWTEITSNPLTKGRIGVAVAMHTSGRRIYLIGARQENGPGRTGSGLFRSDDQGATWKRMATDDRRIAGGGYICGVWVDTQNPDVLYTMSTAAYKSTDGGVTFHAFKGAPGGEDMHDVWIDPTDGKRMLFGVDQGAAVTFDGGLTWSSYYAMPIAQVYHIATDNRYPYWVMATQQDTGAVMTRTRGDVGQISEVDWMPLPSSEFGTLTPDPNDPNIIYGLGYGAAGGGGSVLKINLTTGQWENVAPDFGANAKKYHSSGDNWRRIDPFDPHAIYIDMQCLMVSHDMAHSWKVFSPDLTAEKDKPKPACGTPEPTPEKPAATPANGRPAVPPPPPPAIADFAISTARKGVFWTVSSNRQIYNTTDGGAHWNNVSNIGEDAGVTFNNIEAGHADVNTAYLCGRLGSRRGGGFDVPGNNAPLIWRTHDGGKTWTKIVNGLPSDQLSGSWVNVIREDPKQKGLLFAGTETTVYVSFDDGDHWQSLRQNLPSTSIRDMVFHMDDHMSDLVIGTYGRGFYVLDDTTPLREIATKSREIAAAPVYFFKPGDAIRARVSDNWDQPLNPELTHAPNPPYGAIFYYNLKRPPSGELKLEILDAEGKLVRTMSSVPPELPEHWPYPDYWVAKKSDLALPTQAGTNRFNWDLRYDDPPAFDIDLEDQMNVSPTQFVTPGPHGPQAIPGVYTMKLTVDGQTYTQTLTLHNDPRVGESAKVMADLRAKNKVMLLACQGAKDSYAGNSEVLAVRQQVAALLKNQLSDDMVKATKDIDAKLATFGGIATRGPRAGSEGEGRPRWPLPPPDAMKSFDSLNNNFNRIVSTSQVGLDEAPTQAQIDTWESDCKDYNTTVAAWKKMQSEDVVSFNALLSKGGLNPLQVTATGLSTSSCPFAAPTGQGRPLPKK
jgi:photosystem II stability/assembly factor-like uncharacterized protein